MNAHERLVYLQEQLQDASARLHGMTHATHGSRSSALRDFLNRAAQYGRFVARYVKGRVQ